LWSKELLLRPLGQIQRAVVCLQRWARIVFDAYVPNARLTKIRELAEFLFFQATATFVPTRKKDLAEGLARQEKIDT